jgi:hypothetical protein
VTETCLAMTIFRDEFDVKFIVMFGFLLFVKCFSWIGGGRVEFVGCPNGIHAIGADDGGGDLDGTTTSRTPDYVPYSAGEQLANLVCRLCGNGLACRYVYFGEGEAKYDGELAVIYLYYLVV